MIGLPDPEMRKFLANGTVETVFHALVPHQSRGLKITESNETTTVIYNGGTLTFPTKQQLKLTMREVNALMDEKGPKG